MKRKILAVCTTVALALGLAAVGAGPASAHTARLTGMANCAPATGTAVVTWTLTNDHPSTATVTGSNNPSIPKGSTVAAKTGKVNGSATFTQNIEAPAAGKLVSASLTLTWSDKFYGPASGSVTVPSNCTPPPPADVKDATASVATTTATCDVPGTAEFTINNAVWTTEPSTEAGSHVRTATANAGHQFSDGTATASVPYTIEPKLDATKPPCYVAPPVVKVPQIQDYVKCEGAAFVLDNTGSNSDVVYTVNGVEFSVPAGQAVHTDADGVLIQPNKDDQYVITADGRDEPWVFEAKDCTVTPPTEEPTTPPTDEPTTPPTGEPSTPPTDEPTEEPTATPELPGETPITEPTPVATPIYENCDAANADGRKDIPEGDVAYNPALDLDKDGKACDSTAVTAKAAAPSTTDTDSLAYTGSDPTPYVIGAAILALLGTALVLIKRRRKSVN